MQTSEIGHQTNWSHALVAGIVGATVLNVVHETARKKIPNAPHMDLLAMKALGFYLLKPLGVQMNPKTLRRITLAGDVISNSLYYAATVGTAQPNAKAIFKKASLWGAITGVCAIVLPPVFQLKQQFTRNAALTNAMTFAWYFLGSIATAATLTAIRSQQQQQPEFQRKQSALQRKLPAFQRKQSFA